MPQHRVRLFLVCTQSKAPLNLQLHQRQHIPASSFIDFDAGKWSKVAKPGRAESTLLRVKNGRERFGDRFICSTTDPARASLVEAWRVLS
ncbi:hypothetical protein D3C85_766110 [compost metagenome]